MSKNEESISIICPSPKGAETALKLTEALNASLYLKTKKTECISKYEDNKRIKIYSDVFDLKHVTNEAFMRTRKIIIIGSTGIAVRAIAPFISSKDVDPAVLVVDLGCNYVISLLSGHLGGANEFTLKVAKLLNAIPVITTATDNMGITAPDIIAKDNNLIIEDLKKAKYFSSLLVDKKKVYVKDDYDMVALGSGYEKSESLRENTIWITDKIKENEDVDYKKVLRLLKKDIVLGIGCRKNTSYKKLKEFIKKVLKENNIDIRCVKEIVSVDVKAEEQGIIELSQDIGCCFKTFSKGEIKNVHEKFEKSEFVLKTLGIYSVCEPCVELAGAEIIINKIKQDGMTLAVGIIK